MNEQLTRRHVERWGRDIIDRVKSDEFKHEDCTVEFKRELVEPRKAARRIAAHANAARCEPILWIIGYDEKGQTFHNVEHDFADWWGKVVVCFDDRVSPSLIELSIVEEGNTIWLLGFETNRSPYVIKNSTGTGPVDREVPWREGTSTRSAKRHELLKMLPGVKVPNVETVSISAELQTPSSGTSLRVKVLLYVEVLPGHPVSIPRHRIRAVPNVTVWRAGKEEKVDLDINELFLNQTLARTVTLVRSDYLTIETIHPLSALANPNTIIAPSKPFRFRMNVSIVHNRGISIDEILHPSNKPGSWRASTTEQQAVAQH